MHKRNAIELTADERRRYLADAPTIILVTNGHDGYPHAVPMWFLVEDDGSVLMTTYGRSQKVVNVRRNSKVALLVESGTRYDELKGVLLRGDAEVVENETLCVRVLTKIHAKHSRRVGERRRGGDEGTGAQTRRPQDHAGSIVSWDHRKLGGAY
jgi:general stress protein 26